MILLGLIVGLKILIVGNGCDGFGVCAVKGFIYGCGTFGGWGRLIVLIWAG